MPKTYDKPTVKLAGSIDNETDLAICISTEDRVGVWLPKSQVPEIHRNPKGVSEFVIYEWLAIDKRLV